MPQAPGGVLSVRRLNRALPERQMLLRRRCECQGVLLRKFLITLLSAPPERAFRAPYTSPDKDFTILRVTDGTVFIIVTVAEGKRSSGVMSFLERRFASRRPDLEHSTEGCCRQGRRRHETPFVRPP